jgi:hypothetical protein
MQTDKKYKMDRYSKLWPVYFLKKKLVNEKEKTSKLAKKEKKNCSRSLD